MLSPYGPVGYWAAAAVVKATGLSLAGPRLLVIGFALAAAALLVGLTRRMGGSRSVGAVFAAAFFCHPVVWIWLPLLRVDLPSVALSLAGLYVFARWRSLVLAAVLFVAAVFTKQTAIAAPLACVVALALERQWRFIGILAADACALAVLLAASLGPYAYFHLVLTHRDAFDVLRYLDNLRIVVGGSLVLLLAIAYGLTAGHGAHAHRRLAWLYLGTCTLLTITAGKAGAETNHFLEWVSAAALLGAVSMPVAAAAWDRGATLVLAAVVVVSAVSVIGAWQRPRRDVDPAACSEAYRFIREYPGGPILSEDVSALLLAGKPVAVTDPFAYAQVRGVTWAKGGLEGLVARRYFNLVVAGPASFEPGHRPARWTRRLGAEVGREYRLVRSFGCSSSLGAVYVRAGATPGS